MVVSRAIVSCFTVALNVKSISQMASAVAKWANITQNMDNTANVLLDKFMCLFILQVQTLAGKRAPF